eukprot:TRINITY_DN13160_c0_g1_i2.p1 TRINITY_DN13160_c0_g1~~TRINITY_DN13160_c0_g1_i2.p1  ORF type:complete len:970 (+),score=160.09 TRINITY_DN13160_c0_g1_i2:192-3101(+)
MEERESRRNGSLRQRGPMMPVWMLLVLAAALTPVEGGTWSLSTAVSGTHSTEFGFCVGVHGDTAVVGAPFDDTNGTDAGAVYVYVRVSNAWSLQQKLIAESANSTEEYFGRSVALDGDTVVAGGPRTDWGTSPASAYVFTRSGSTWTQQARLESLDSGQLGTLFGHAVAISRDRVIVGEPKSSYPGYTNAGMATVFTRSGTVWSIETGLSSNSPSAEERFSDAVSVELDVVLVGAEMRNSGGGGAYVFANSASSASSFSSRRSVWTQLFFVAGDSSTSRHFGRAVGLSEGIAVISEPGKSTYGALQVYSANTSTVEFLATIAASDQTSGAWMGDSVSIYKSTIAAGAPNIDAVYMFSITASPSFSWKEEAKLESPLTQKFGYSVSTHGEDTLLAGAPDTSSAAVIISTPTAAPTPGPESSSSETVSEALGSDEGQAAVSAVIAVSVVASVAGGVSASASTSFVTSAASSASGAEAAALIMSAQGVALFSQMDSVQDSGSGGLGDSMSWTAGQAFPNVGVNDQDHSKERRFINSLLILAILALLAFIHYIVNKITRLPRALEFPVPEFMVSHIVFGALCTSASLVIDPNGSTDWPYAVGGALVFVATALYWCFVAKTLRDNESEFLIYRDTVSWKEAFKGKPLGYWRPGLDQADELRNLTAKLQGEIQQWLQSCARCAAQHRVGCQRCRAEHVLEFERLGTMELTDYVLMEPIEQQMILTMDKILVDDRPFACPPKGLTLPAHWNLERDVQELALLAERTGTVKNFRRDASQFIRRYAAWYSGFVPHQSVVELSFLGAVWVMALAIGLLQAYAKAQIIVVFGVHLALLAVLCARFPYNLKAQWPFELFGVACQVGSSFMMLLYVFDVAVSVANVVSLLQLGSMLSMLGFMVLTQAWRLSGSAKELEDTDPTCVEGRDVAKPPPLVEAEHVWTTHAKFSSDDHMVQRFDVLPMAVVDLSSTSCNHDTPSPV